MTTYAVMQARIADELTRSDLTTQIQKAILSAIKHYERVRFYFNASVTDTFSTVADQEYYGSAANSKIPNLVMIDALTVTSSSIKSRLENWPFEVIEGSQNSDITGQPTAFCYYAQQIRLYPIPDAVYTVTGSWLYRLTALSADGDTNAWTTDAEELIRNRASCDLLWRVIDNPERAQYFRMAEMEALKALEMETAQRQSVPRLGVDPGIMAAATFDYRTG